MANEYGNYANALTLAAREQTNFNPDSQSWTYTNGNLTFEHTASGGDAMFPFSQPMQPGSKYHFEFTTNSFHSSVYARFAFFLMPVIEYQKTSNPIVNTNSKTFQVSLIRSGGTGANEAKFNNSAITTPTNKPTTGSRITIEVDMSTVGSTTVRYYFNGSLDTTWSSLAFTDTPYYVGIFTGTETDRNGVHSVNFGQTAFADTVTADHIRLNTASMSTPAVVNYEDEYYIQAGISHSNGSTTAVTLPKTVSGGAMVRIKRTDSDAGTSDWICFDTARGVNKAIFWNATAAEDSSTYDDQNLTGTTLTMPSDLTTGTYMIECFYVGSYFAILEDEGNGQASRSISHGGGFLPAFIWRKNLDRASYNSVVFHKSVGTASYLYGSSASAIVTGEGTAGAWAGGTFTTSVIIVGSNNDANQDNDNFVSYLWADAGPYSFGSYNGNQDTDGAFVNLGGFPQVIVSKPPNTGDSYLAMYHPLLGYNPNGVRQYWEENYANSTSTSDGMLDFVSNGVKFRTAGTGNNSTNSGYGTYLYFAFGIQSLTDGGVNQGRAR